MVRSLADRTFQLRYGAEVDWWAYGGTLMHMALPIHWKSRRAAACGRAELLAKKRHTDRLQNPAKLRRFRIGSRLAVFYQFRA